MILSTSAAGGNGWEKRFALKFGLVYAAMVLAVRVLSQGSQRGKDEPGGASIAVPPLAYGFRASVPKTLRRIDTSMSR